jgi:lipoyl(octanoyl) transferase
MPDTLTVCALGRTSYAEATALQAALVEARAAGTTGDWLLFVEHPPVVTAGRGAHADSLRVPPEQLARLGVEFHESSRGGDVTWHGPGQLVGYPICDLSARGRDLHQFLRALEQALIDALGGWGISATRAEGLTGVWVDGGKIASIGIAVRRWVSYHGFALNVAPDLAGFDLIHPCGLRGVRMTSVQARLGDAAPGPERAREDVAEAVRRRLGYRALSWAPPEAAWRVAQPACSDARAAASKAADGYDARPDDSNRGSHPC